MNSLSKQTTSLFSTRFGYLPEGVWSAPGRVNLIGEHTDYNGGFVFPLAINRRTYAAVAPRNDGMIRVSSSFTDEVKEIELDAIQPGKDFGWEAYPFGISWAIAQKIRETNHQAELPGFDAFIHSDVPVGAGLSSSAAIECAIGVALNELWRGALDAKTIAKCGQTGENQIVGAPTGIMDQTASMLGLADHGVLIDCRSLEVEPIELGFAAAELELLIIDTRVAHRLVDGGYAERRASCESASKKLGVKFLRELSVADLESIENQLTAMEYRRVRHVITENQRVLDAVATLRNQGPQAIGELLHRSHSSLRDDYNVSIAELDLAVEIAIGAGAIGARMTGGGFGGAAIALTPKALANQVSQAISAAFRDANFAQPHIFSVYADDGAGRES